MRVLSQTGREDIATVYLAEMEPGRFVEFVESLQPPIPRGQKWVLIVSTMYGCPVACMFCDAGGLYQGNLTARQIKTQIDYLIRKRYPNGKIPVKNFKIQFARIGEPAFNNAVLEVLDSLVEIYDAPGLTPCISTIAPKGRETFFEQLMEIKKRKYPTRFQLQFSIHTTDKTLRDRIIPVKKWDFPIIARYGERFFNQNGRKITLNFALADSTPLDPDQLLQYFDPQIFLVKITPVNPTYAAAKSGLSSRQILEQGNKIVEAIRSRGYDTILSIGELEENKIGSNCGQYLLQHLSAKKKIDCAYTYTIKEIS